MKLEKGSQIETLLAGAAVGMFVMMAARGADRLWRSWEQMNIERLHAGNEPLKRASAELSDIQIRQKGKGTRFP